MEESRFELFMRLTSSVGKTIQRMKSAKMEKYGLGSTHTTCLCKLAKAGERGMTQKELAEQEGMDRAQISRVLRDLEIHDLLQTAGDSVYKKRYCLTKKGIRTAEEVQEIILEINQYVSDEFSKEEIAVFYNVLQKINEKLIMAEEKYC